MIFTNSEKCILRVSLYTDNTRGVIILMVFDWKLNPQLIQSNNLILSGFLLGQYIWIPFEKNV